jgi:hypothetical protein
MLIVTNGDSAIAALKEAGIPGHIFPWRDVLHQGPVVGGSLDAVSEIRATFIADRGWGSHASVAADFKRRDEKLRSAQHHDELVVWLEHDLYDQLQLFQIFDWLDRNPFEDTAVSLICHDTFITTHDADQLADRFANRDAVTTAQLDLGRRAWAAFTAATPEPWEALLHADTGKLPFLGSAMERLLQELPGADGLSRTERQVLTAMEQGHVTPSSLFRATQGMEDTAFMGDASFWDALAGLILGAAPLLAADGGFRLPNGPRPEPGFLRQPLDFTTAGREVLAGRLDWLTLQPLDKWLGGIHLGPSVWRWHSGARQLLSS